MSELPEGWESDFPFAALSVKPSQASGAKLALDKINSKRATGHKVELHLWEWCDFTNKDTARAFGKKMALACLTYGATRFYANAEAQWAGVEDYAYTAEPYQNMSEFMVMFYLLCPEGCELVYNGFSWARTSDGRKLHDAYMIRGFNGWCPMIYGTSAANIVRGFDVKLAKYSTTTPNTKRIPMIGVGRIDEQGAVWGYWRETFKAIQRHRCEEVAFFFGNGAKSRYFGSHKDHPALVLCAKELAA